MAGFKFRIALLFGLIFLFFIDTKVLGLGGKFYMQPDSIYLSADSMIVFRDSVLVPSADTLVIIDEGIHYKLKKNRYKKSQAFYDSLYYKTQNKKLTSELYHLLMDYIPEDQNSESGQHTKAENSFEEYSGKIIRSIDFIKVDILEGSVHDTLKMAHSKFGEILNKTHIDTQSWVLKKFMLVSTGDQVIPGIIADNERIIRDLPAIEDVKFVLIGDSIHSEFVDLIVITKDVFPFGATATASSLDVFSASLWNDNAFGLAYTLGGGILYNGNYSNPWGYELFTKYRNIGGSFIDGSLVWTDAFNTNWLSLNLQKDFLTPQTKWGGGLSIGWIKDEYELAAPDTIITGDYKSNYQDIWLGRSFLLGDKDSRKNLILSARFERSEYIQRPFVSLDSNAVFHNKNIYYAKIGYSDINFYKSSMVRSYGIAEDIPFGVNSGLTLAYLESDFLSRLYFGFSIGAAKYFNRFGYLAGNVLFSSFYKNGKASQGLIQTNVLFYTPLLHLNRYKTRSFLSLRLTKAITRDVETDIDFGDLVRSIDQNNISGLTSLVINYEFVLFSPWYFYGFRFAPYAFADMGLIGNTRSSFVKSSLFSAIGIGFRIQNESFAFKTIIISFGYLPNNIGENADWFYEFYMGEDPLVPLLKNDRPFILERQLILPF